MRYPVDSPVVRAAFGLSPWPVTGTHQGCDYVAPTGTPLYPIRSGRVSYINWNHPTMGNAIEIDIGGGLFTRYLHCSEILASVGQNVNESTVVARAGWTGLVDPPNSDGAHLHGELYNKANNQPSGYQSIDSFIRNNGGTNMKITLDAHRQIYWGILGRNGLAGRSNALTGQADGEWNPNQELTPQYLQDVFLSAESREYRDGKGTNSNYELGRRYDLFPALEKSVNQLTADNGKLATTNASLEASLATKDRDLEELREINTNLTKANKILTTETERLKKELQNTPDTGFHLNIFGRFLYSLGIIKGEKE